MKNHLLYSISIGIVILLFACKADAPIVEYQNDINLDTIKISSNSKLDIYRASETRDFDLLHTKLEVSFDWDSTYLYGKASLLLKPYFYNQSKLKLDAKGFQIKEVAQLDEIGIKTPLLYTYDSLTLNIELGKSYTKSDSISIFIDYVAMPNKLKEGGSAAITSDKGLYFINPTGEDSTKPKQIWTQGETEASSCWFPTIDSPNERTTQEIYITVDSNYVTLSNGNLLFQTENADGTRTDYWKQNLPHAPYLFMIAIGEFAVVEDSWKDKEVNYYVEPKYKDFAKDIFPNTVEMISFFSDKLGYEYPWDKFSQVVVRDYVSGAMENTSAVIYGEFVQGDDRFLIDNAQEDIVAHELIHHWFGDLVTCESWSNLPLNESFATYGEYLWNEHKYGADKAEYHLFKDLRAYLAESRTTQKEMIRFHYEAKEDMFDAHSYQKGGRILHMLRKLVGDEAFFLSLENYLKENEFQSVEIHDLRLAFEEVTGMDLNWFFNQWFFKPGHPNIEVNYDYNDSSKTLVFNIEQTQNYNISPYAYELNTNIEVFFKGGGKEIIPIAINKRKQSFEIPLSKIPSFAKLDTNNDLLAEIEQSISEENSPQLFAEGENFLDRYYAIDKVKSKSDSMYLDLIEKGLNDPFWYIRRLSLRSASKLCALRGDKVLARLNEMALNDSNSRVRAEAFETIASNYPNASLDNFKKGLKDKSYLVVASSLEGIYALNPSEGVKIAKDLEKEDNSNIQYSIARIYAEDGGAEHQGFFLNLLNQKSGSSLYSFTSIYGAYILKQEDSTIKESLPILQKIGTEQSAWWVRMASIYTIVDLYYQFDEEKKRNTNQIALSQDQNTIVKLENRNTEVEKMQVELKGILESIKQNETEDNLIRIINQVLE